MNEPATDSAILNGDEAFVDARTVGVPSVMAVFPTISALLDAPPRRMPDRGFILGQALGGLCGFLAAILLFFVPKVAFADAPEAVAGEVR